MKKLKVAHVHKEIQNHYQFLWCF